MLGQLAKFIYGMRIKNYTLKMMDMEFPPNKLTYIFQAFDKKGCTSGTGIGLPFCKQVMESMGGRIECNSTLGNGTEFILTFTST